MNKAFLASGFLMLAVLVVIYGLNGATAHEDIVAAQQTAASVRLPLKRGYYVVSDTPCSEASNATTALLRRDGIGGAHDFCAFKAVERVSADTYRVTQACADLQSTSLPETTVATYALLSDTHFISKRADGREYNARYCAQAVMPAAFRANDIDGGTDE